MVSHQGENYVIIDVSGVGYRVYISQNTFSVVKVGREVFFWTHLSIREKAMDLYGFSKKSELDFFEMLLNVSGVGPKSAISILNLASVDYLKKAIAGGDEEYLTKVSGIGKRIALKIIAELRETLEKQEDISGEKGLEGEVTTLEALKTLGYTTQESRSALRKIKDTSLDTNKRIKEALKILNAK